jgi:hypothetical protein
MEVCVSGLIDLTVQLSSPATVPDRSRPETKCWPILKTRFAARCRSSSTLSAYTLRESF